MNGLRPAIQRATVAAMRRGKATLAPQQGVHNLPPQTAVPPYLKMKLKSGTFKENWLSDPSTYPILVIMGGALTFMTGMGLHALAYYKDVRINPSNKHSELQTRGIEKVMPLVGVIGDKNPYYKVAFYEGIGINHEEWLKQKEATDRAQRA